MFAYCRNNPVINADPVGSFDWNTLASGATLLTIGITACAVAATVLTAGACAPLMAVAATTWVAGAMTIANGASEVSEGITGYNPMEQVICGGDERLYTTQKTVYAVTAEVGTAVLSVASQFGVCFVAGTRVQTADGTKNIEEIQPGDLVWAWDEETNKTELKPVVETYINEATELTHLFVGSEEIVCTPGHKFYAPKKGWTDACRLRAGDILVLVNGEYVVVEKIQHELLESPVAIYNFQVQDDHTYYVSNIGVLVHNDCGDIGPYNRLRRENAGSGNQVHHILPKRFLDQSIHDTIGKMQGIVLTISQHLTYTNAWKEALPYGKKYSAEEIANAARKVYSEARHLFEIVLQELK